jgi:hypothetical protein
MNQVQHLQSPLKACSLTRELLGQLVIYKAEKYAPAAIGIALLGNSFY